jgi:purine-cytosine permease-like protein
LGSRAVSFHVPATIGLLIGNMLGGIVIARHSAQCPRLGLAQTALTSGTGGHHERLDPPGMVVTGN